MEKTDNELIAEFMGVTVWKSWGEYLDATYYKMHHGKPTNDSPLTEVQVYENKIIESKNVYAPMRYNTSWDWLMPVVEKINQLGHDGFIRPESKVYAVIDLPIISPMEKVHKAVVEFIKFYNQQSK